MDSNGHTERLGDLLVKAGWPKSKDEAATIKKQVELTQEEIRCDRRFKTLARLARELLYILPFRNDPRQSQKITDCLARMQEAAK